MLCGKAHLLLKEVEEARNHYRKAITSNEKELLAWKVFSMHQRWGQTNYTISRVENVLSTLDHNYVNTIRLCLWEIDVYKVRANIYCPL